MCNHYRLNPEAIPTWAEWAGYNLPSIHETMEQSSADVWPKRPGLVVHHGEAGPTAETMRWGFARTMPGKRPGTTVTKNVTNVRNLTSPYWRSMLANPEQRCLVPFSQFAEPKMGQGREEWWFTISDEPVSAFAGIWRPTDEGRSYAFLTCEPNPLVAPLHPKAMPVIVHREDYDKWLRADWSEASALVAPYPSQLMGVG